MTEHKSTIRKLLPKHLRLIKFLTGKEILRKSFERLIQSLDEGAIKFICGCVQYEIFVSPYEA